MNTILLILCNALSCFIISTILFQFMNGKYKKSSQSRYVYIVIETVTVIFTTCINMLNHSILNLVVWGVLTGIIAYALYYEDMDKPLRRIIECEALVFCMSVCESLGVILLQCILQAADIKNVNETMLYCLEVTFSKVILIFLYYTFINRFVKKSDIPYATHTSFYVNGQKAFTAITGMSYLPSEIQTFGTVQQPFKTRGYKPYDPSTNSITIGVGSRFNLGNGYSMTVQEDFVWGEGYGNGSKADDERCNMMIGGLKSLIHFADQQYFSSMTDTYTDYILDFLASQGVDTSREFVINGTHCELVNGKIREVGNDYVVPSAIQQKAVKRYEESMSQLLNSGTWYRWS